MDCGQIFREHLERVLEKGKARHAILARAAGSTRGLETSILRQAHAALLVRLFRHGVVPLASHVFGGPNHQHCSAAQHGSARITTLHVMAGAFMAHNLYILNWAFAIDRVLRARNCSFNGQMRGWLAGNWQILGWTRNRRELRGALGTRSRRGEMGIIATCRLSGLRSRACALSGMSPWADVSLHVLASVGWRPDDSIPRSRNLAGAPPPLLTTVALSLFGPATAWNGYRISRLQKLPAI